MQFSFSGYFCACGKSGISFLHNSLSILLVRVPGAYLASKYFPQTLLPMGLANAAGSLFSILVCVIAYAITHAAGTAHAGGIITWLFPQLYSIGEMAKIFHLSVSSLRHYEALGLVTPEYVDSVDELPLLQSSASSSRSTPSATCVRSICRSREIADFLRNRDVENIEEKLRAQKAAVVQKEKGLKRIERKIDTSLRRLREVQRAPLGDDRTHHSSPALPPLLGGNDADRAGLQRRLSSRRASLVAAQSEALVFLGKVGFSVSQEHLNEGIFEQYDGAFLVLDERRPRQGRNAHHCPKHAVSACAFTAITLQAPEQYRRLLPLHRRERPAHRRSFARDRRHRLRLHERHEKIHHRDHDPGGDRVKKRSPTQIRWGALLFLLFNVRRRRAF